MVSRDGRKGVLGLYADEAYLLLVFRVRDACVNENHDWDQCVAFLEPKFGCLM